MKSYCTLLILIFLYCAKGIKAQSQSIDLEDIEVSSTKVVKLGHSPAIRDLQKKQRTSEIKRENNRKNKKVPENFKGRRGYSKSIYEALEHQGPDPIRQSSLGKSDPIKPFVNIDGIGDFGSPHDPSGDVSDQYYVQMINATVIGVFDLEGNLLSEFAANTLWTEFDQSSAGDPIVLYDESVDRWILTEFADPANVLIAISDTGDPLGEYSAYNFSTPNFPDYPKYGLSPDILTFTSNEEGAGELHQYFIDLNAMYNGEEEVNMQRIRLPGNSSTEAGFYVTTPVDWNGQRNPFDNKPITMILNDSSWDGGPAQDQIDVYTFDINFLNEDSTSVSLTSIVTSPFDPYPCSESGEGFACVPQSGGAGLDGVPEVIMNIPHMRNFGSHESIVFSFVTDATDGDNISGIRWVELRRTGADADWRLYQEGTYAPNDGLDRFMPSIAIDDKGNIGLAYNITSKETFVGARFTGRTQGDPLGIMTVEESVIVNGRNTIPSGERFGDYSQMSVSPNDDAFWWTSEYAGTGTFVTQTRIVAFKINRDTFDLSVREIADPITSATLSANESVTATIVNSGLEPISNYNVQLLFEDEILETIVVNETLLTDSLRSFTFETKLDLSQINRYDIGAIVNAEKDQNALNDTLRVGIRQLYPLEGSLSGKVQQGSCADIAESSVTITSDGANPIDSVAISVEVNGVLVDTIYYSGSISFQQSATIDYDIEDFEVGDNTVKFTIISINALSEDGILENNSFEQSANKLAADQFITLEFTTDDFPEESTWELFSEVSGNLVASGSFSEGRTTTIENICAHPDSCYNFILTDAYADGICCDFGNGQFNIYDNEGLLIVSNNGQFGASTLENFCARGIDCSMQIEASSVAATGEENADGIIMVEVSGGVDPYQFSIDGGETFQDSSTFINLLPGDYEILVADDSGFCQKTDSVTIEFSSAIWDTDGQLVTIDISPNPSEGIFKILIKDLSTEDPQLRIEILDLTGHVIQSRKIGNYSGSFLGTFSLFDYPSGTYVLKIVHHNYSHLERMIKL